MNNGSAKAGSAKAGSVCMRLTREEDKKFSLFTKVPRDRVARMLEDGWRFTTKNRYRKARRDAEKREARRLYGDGVGRPPVVRVPFFNRNEPAPLFSGVDSTEWRKAGQAKRQGLLERSLRFLGRMFGKGAR